MLNLAISHSAEPSSANTAGFLVISVCADKCLDKGVNQTKHDIISFNLMQVIWSYSAAAS